MHRKSTRKLHPSFKARGMSEQTIRVTVRQVTIPKRTIQVKVVGESDEELGRKYRLQQAALLIAQFEQVNGRPATTMDELTEWFSGRPGRPFTCSTWPNRRASSRRHDIEHSVMRIEILDYAHIPL